MELLIRPLPCHIGGEQRLVETSAWTLTDGTQSGTVHLIDTTLIVCVLGKPDLINRCIHRMEAYGLLLSAYDDPALDAIDIDAHDIEWLPRPDNSEEN